MKKLLSVVLLGLFFGLMAQAQTVVIPEKIPFGKDTMVPPKVKSECQIEEKIARFMVEFAKKAGINVVREKPSGGEYLVLSAEVINVVGAGGGAWSGSKSIKIKGEVKDQNGKVVANFTAGRYSGGGAFAGYKGTCSILGRCTKAIGKDVGTWLIDPQPNAMLGDH